MKLGQFLDKVDSWDDVIVDIWVQSKDYEMVGGVPQWVTNRHHVVFEKPKADKEVGEYLNNTLLDCFICRDGSLECIVKG